jgi:hypothetical protein
MSELLFSDHRIADEWSDDELYFSDKKSISNSMLGILDDSPTKFDLFMKGKWSYPHADYFDIGTGVHQMYLEGVDNRLLVEGTRRTKAFKETKDENPDKIVLPTSDYNLVEKMVDKLHKVPELRGFVEGFSEKRPELAASMTITTPKGNKISVKGKADMLLSDGFSAPTLLDLKTSGKGLKDWKRNAYYGNYPRQAYLYSQLFQTEEFHFAVITKTFPYEVGLYKASDAFLAKGKKMLEDSIANYEYLFLENNYRPYSAAVGTL